MSNTGGLGRLGDTIKGGDLLPRGCNAMTDAEVETIASEQKVAKRQGDESSLRIVSGSWKIGMRY